MDVEFRRIYGAEFRFGGVGGRDRVGCVMVFVGLLRRLVNSWFVRRGFRPVLRVSDDYSDVWLEWDDGARRIYIEIEVWEDCGGAEGVLEVVGFDGRVFSSLWRAFLREVELASVPVGGGG